MKKYGYILIIIHLLTQVVHAQINDSLPNLDLAKIAQVNQSDSYITFPTDIGNLEPLMFEANVNPSFVIRKRKDSRLMGVLTAQITIRMFREDPELYPADFGLLFGERKKCGEQLNVIRKDGPPLQRAGRQF